LAEGSNLVAKDRTYNAYGHEVRKRLDEAKAKVEAERDAIAVDAQKGAADAALKTLNHALLALEQPTAGAGELGEGENALKGADEALAAGSALEKKIGAYASWAKQARGTVTWSRGRYGKRKIAIAAGDNRAQVKDKLSAARSAIEIAKGPDASDGDIS